MVNIFFNVYSWLAGLISTDGSISRAYHGCQITVSTVEDDWAVQIHTTLLSGEIESTVCGPYHGGHDGKSIVFMVYIKNPRGITEELSKSEYQPFFSPRKWKAVQYYADFYRSPKCRYNRVDHLTSQIKTILVDDPKLKDEEIAIKLNVSRSTIRRTRGLAEIKEYRRR